MHRTTRGDDFTSVFSVSYFEKLGNRSSGGSDSKFRMETIVQFRFSYGYGYIVSYRFV